MTVTRDAPAHPWNARPGWGISVDLTPREILTARRVRVHKRLIGAALLLVAVVCTGLTLMAWDDRTAAEGAHDAAQARTVSLRAETARYDEITLLSEVTTETAAQAATLMANDLDFALLMTRIRSGLTSNLVITNETVLLAPATDVAAPAVDPRIIGSVSLAGTGRLIRDLAPFIAIVNHLPGVVDVVPTSTSQTETGMTFTLSMNITDELYTRRFDQAVP